MEKTLPMILQWDESFDIGSDTLTGVNDADYTPPFALTAKLNKLTLKVDRPKLTEEDIKKLESRKPLQWMAVRSITCSPDRNSRVQRSRRRGLNRRTLEQEKGPATAGPFFVR